MPLSLTCSCGAKLEIDDKFAGQVIACPDCRKEIPTTAQPIRALRTSWFAIFAMVFAIIGAFSVVGTLAAVFCGWRALRHIRLYPEKVGGRKFAWAGICLGAAFSLLSLACYYSPDILGLDGFFRQIEWASKLDYGGDLKLSRETSHPAKFWITRPNRSWGIVDVTKLGNLPKYVKDSAKADDLILIQPWYDAQVACLTIESKDADDRMDESISRFESSLLLQLLSRPSSNPVEFKVSKASPTKNVEDGDQFKKDERVVDITVGGYQRTFHRARHQGGSGVQSYRCGCRRHAKLTLSLAGAGTAQNHR